MKQGFILIVCIAISVHTSLAQPNFGVKAGMNINNVTTTDLPNFISSVETMSTVSYHIGLYVQFELNEKFSIIPEMQFTQRGYATEYAEKVRTNINYLEVPVLVVYSPIKLVSVELGPNIGFKISSKTKPDGLGEISYESIDFGLSTGLMFHITDKVSLVGRYYHGFTSIAALYLSDTGNGSFDEASKTFNRSFQIGIGYKIK